MTKSKQQQHGEVWERYIRQECHALRKAELADVGKNWEAPRVPGKFVRREDSKCDFSGVIDGGRHVVFEAKATLIETRFDFDNLTDKQRERLVLADRLGALAFVYVLDGKRRKFLIHIRDIVEEKERSSVALEEGDPRQKLGGETWLDTLQRLIDIAYLGEWS